MSVFDTSSKISLASFIAGLAIGLVSFTNTIHAALKINEFLAANDTVNQDPQGDYDDWVEIYNSGPESISLDGMYLSDDLSEPTQWAFPAGTTLNAGGYLLVWADKDTSDNPLGIHAAFKLSSGGEAIGLFASDGVTLIDSIVFDAQSDDISYGRFPDGSENWYPMDSPSPNATNTAAMSEAVYFSKLGGTFSENFVLKLSTPSNQGSIRYTINGDVPTEDSSSSSLIYDANVGIQVSSDSSIMIRARSYQSGFAAGPVQTEAYLAMSSELEDFESNIPVLVIDTFGTEMPQPGWLYGSIEHADPIITYSAFFNPKADSGMVEVNGIADYAGRTGINIRGQSSAALPKRPYKLETWDENNQDIDVSLFGLPAESDWVLGNPYGDRTFMRTLLALEFSNRMEYYSPRTRMVEVYLNEDGGQVGGPDSDDYRGVYVFTEKIKRNEERVDIDKLSSSDDSEPDITGGYIIRHDKNRTEDSFYTWAGRWFYLEPSHDEITQAQKDYIKNYLETFEGVLQSENFNDPIEGYSKYIDVDSFIVNDFCSEITKEVDTYVYSTYVTKERNGKLQMSPQWDFNISLGNNDYRVFNMETQHHTSGWNRNPGDTGLWEYRWHARLMEDTEYLRRYADLWYHFREDVLSDASILQSIDNKLNSVNAGAAQRNFARWDILNTWAGFSWSGDGPNFYYGGNDELGCPGAEGGHPHTYAMQVEWLKNWLTGQGNKPDETACSNFAYGADYSDRFGWLDENMQARTGFAPAPDIRLNGTLANTGALFDDSINEITFNENDTIYYTLDGTDPREAYTGNIVGSQYLHITEVEQALVNEVANCKVKIPSGASDASGWKSISFDDSDWLSGSTGVGYETSPQDYQNLINLSILGMRNQNTSAYIRIPFSVSDTTAVNSLVLKMKYDDAFVAYINGSEVARSAYAPNNIAWNSEATNYHDDANAVNYETFNINTSISSLQDGPNVLAIQLLNFGIGSSDILCVPQLNAVIESEGTQLILDRSVDLCVRSKTGDTWSALNRAIFSDSKVKDSLRITEIMYNPENSGGEYIELKNTGTEAINLYLCRFSDGIEFTFPDTNLNPGEAILVVEDRAEFLDSYLGNEEDYNIAGTFSNGSKLSNGGETIVLRDALGHVIHDFTYTDSYAITDGNGFSICVNDPASTDLDEWDDPVSWSPSSDLGGNPGENHTSPALGYNAVVINEIVAHSDSATGDWIELHNTTNSSVNIGGWYLSDDKEELKKYQIATGTLLPANGYLVFTQNGNFGTASNDQGKIQSFGLSEYGENVYLSSGSAGVLAGGYSVSQEFGATLNGVSIGRLSSEDPTGENIDFVQLQYPTLGAENAPAFIPEVIIKEIRYNAVDQSDELYEYIELFNRSSETIYLYDPNNPSNTWKLGEGIEFTFPEGVSIPSGGHILITRTDPEIFRHLNNIPSTRMIYGPYNKALDNDRDTIELLIPGTPDAGFVPYLSSEKISYRDGSGSTESDTWPSQPDTLAGYSLQRESRDSYGNSALNWQGLEATPNSLNVQMLELRRNGSSLQLHWIGSSQLQSNDDLSQPWSDVGDITSPHTIDTEETPQQFFRFAD